MRNQWKLADGSRVVGVTGDNVQTVGEEVYRLVTKHGTLDPKVLVTAARPRKSVLHPIIFRLNDAQAATEYRLDIARHLIKDVRVITEEGEETLEQRVYVNVINGTRRGYMLVPTVMGDEILREQVLARAKADLESWRERYRDLQELAEVFAVVDRVLTPTIRPSGRKDQVQAATVRP